MTRSSAGVATRSSSAVAATTSSTATAAPTRPSSARATTPSSGIRATAPTSSKAARASTRWSSTGPAATRSWPRPPTSAGCRSPATSAASSWTSTTSRRSTSTPSAERIRSRSSTLTGTDLRRVNVDLAGALGGSTGDGAADTVIVAGTKGDDSIAADANGYCRRRQRPGRLRPDHPRGSRQGHAGHRPCHRQRSRRDRPGGPGADPGSVRSRTARDRWGPSQAPTDSFRARPQGLTEIWIATLDQIRSRTRCHGTHSQ